MRSKFGAWSVRCWFLGYSKHEEAYRFEKMNSNCVLVIRDAKFIEDTFDGGRRVRRNNEVVVQDDDEETDQDSPQHDETDHEHEEFALENETEPSSERHQRTQSLEKATEVPFPKQHSRHHFPKNCQPQLTDF